MTHTHSGVPEAWDNPMGDNPCSGQGMGSVSSDRARGAEKLGWKELQKQQMNQQGKSLLVPV